MEWWDELLTLTDTALGSQSQQSHSTYMHLFKRMDTVLAMPVGIKAHLQRTLLICIDTFSASPQSPACSDMSGIIDKATPESTP